MKFKPYEEYKKVDLPWVEEIPSHWEMTRLKRVLIENQSGNWGEDCLSDKYDIYVLRSTEQSEDGKWRIDWRNVAVRNIKNLNEKNLLKKNDLLLTKSSGSFNHIGKVSIVTEDIEQKKVTFSNFMQKLKVRENISAYFYWLVLNSRFVKEQYRILSTTTTGLSNLNVENINNIIITLPPKEEQDKIADFLDYNLAKIDRFVELTERQIELLKEQKEVIINDAVTKGIDKDVVYKDSGIDWIGEIPEHWEVTRLKRVSYMIKTGGTPKSFNEKHLSNNGLNWYSPADFKDSLILDKAKRKLSIEGATLVNTFPENSILIIGIGGTLGKVGLAKNKFSCNQQINVITPNFSYMHSIFLLYFLYNSKKAIINKANYTTLPILNQEETSNLLVLLPTKKEQEEIVNYIEEETNKIDRTIELYKNQIELIKEYRTSLIASAVTGKIDVRDF